MMILVFQIIIKTIIDLSQQENQDQVIEKKIQDLYKVAFWLKQNYPIESYDELLSSQEFYSIFCEIVQDRSIDICVFNSYSISLQVLEQYLFQNHELI
jgi:hypothetical protein